MPEPLEILIDMKDAIRDLPERLSILLAQVPRSITVDTPQTLPIPSQPNIPQGRDVVRDLLASEHSPVQPIAPLPLPPREPIETPTVDRPVHSQLPFPQSPPLPQREPVTLPTLEIAPREPVVLPAVERYPPPEPMMPPEVLRPSLPPALSPPVVEMPPR